MITNSVDKVISILVWGLRNILNVKITLQNVKFLGFKTPTILFQWEDIVMRAPDCKFSGPSQALCWVWTERSY